MEYTGGCLCGGTRYVLKTAPFALGDCHCIDDPAPFAPAKAIFLEDKLPWVALNEAIPSFPKIPQPSK